MNEVRGVAVYVDCDCKKGRPVMRHPMHGQCNACAGEGVVRVRMSLEDFAKLFAYGPSYSAAAMRGEEAPRNEIRVAEKESTEDAK